MQQVHQNQFRQSLKRTDCTAEEDQTTPWDPDFQTKVEENESSDEEIEDPTMRKRQKLNDERATPTSKIEAAISSG